MNGYSDPISDAISAEKSRIDNYLRNERQKRVLRRDFAVWTKGIVNRWIAGLAIFFLILTVCRIYNPKLRLFSDLVLVTLLGTSTATIIGLPLVIIKGLFPRDENNKDKDRPSSEKQF